MGKAILSLLIISLFFIDPLCHAQTSVKVSDPRLEMKDNMIHIYFDILNSDPEEKYIISLEIKDEDGKRINAKALQGDIGEDVSGGNNKHITWNLEADHVFIDAYVFVQINAKIIPSPKPVIVEPGKKPVQEEQEDQTAAPTEEPKEENIVREDVSKDQVSEEGIKKEESPPVTKSKTFNRTGIIMQSLAFPGFGLSRVTGKPHWLRGAAGYGCIAGSIIMNRLAINTYNGIEDLVYFDEINEAYDKSLQQDNISEILFYTAIGIWVTDFVWTLIGTSDLNERIYSGNSRGFSLGSNIDPMANVPLVSIIYRF